MLNIFEAPQTRLVEIADGHLGFPLQLKSWQKPRSNPMKFKKET